MGTEISEVQIKNINKTLEIPTKVSEIIIIQEQFNNMLARLEKSYSLQRRFSAHTAHELKTPITIMQTKMEFFEKEENKSNEDYEELFQLIKTQNNKINQIVTILLEMASTSAAKITEEVAIKDLIEEIILDLGDMASKKQIEISLEGPNLPVLANSILIYRGFYNIIENAIKYNKASGKVIIKIEKNNQNRVVVDIEDTGFGISKSDADYIFEAFYRGNPLINQKSSGYGLGLTLAKEIFQQHQGNIDLVKNSKEGILMKISLPLVTKKAK